MNKPEQLKKDEQLGRPVFVSYATANRKEALALCKAIERRGVECWVSTRNVEPGENYQEAIVAAIQNARAMVLVFSDAANHSNEIKKELSLASRFDVTVIAVRIEDVQPSNAFAYELSTRQWIDAFESWDKSIDMVVARLAKIDGAKSDATPQADSGKHRRSARPSLVSGRNLALAASIALVLIVAGVAWWFVRPHAAAAHTMQVRLTGFERLSPDLPASMPDAMRGEIISAFSDDGVIGVSTAAAPATGDAPAYALGGTIRHDGDKVRVIARLSDERSGTTLWSNSFTYAASDVSKVPRHIAVDAGNLVRCGLFGASTYPKPLPDAVLADYLQFCHNSGSIQIEPSKALYFAQKVVAAEPDFSWGWSAVEIATTLALSFPSPGADPRTLRKQGLDAAATAIRLDRSNSEAFTYKSLLVDPNDLVARESLLRQAIHARPLACGCEHHFYGYFLEGVGRTRDAIGEYRRSTDVIALKHNSQLSLGRALLVVGKPEEAKEHLDAYVDLSNDPFARSDMIITLAPVTGDYTQAAKLLRETTEPLPAALKKAWLTAFDALASNNSEAKAAAVSALLALPHENRGRVAADLLGALGASSEALKVVDTAPPNRIDAPEWLFDPTMAGARADPGFPAVAQRLGLMKYWKTTHTKPDVCSAKDPPPFCRMI